MLLERIEGFTIQQVQANRKDGDSIRLTCATRGHSAAAPGDSQCLLRFTAGDTVCRFARGKEDDYPSCRNTAPA